MTTMHVSGELKGLLNEAIARELQVSVQYMWQHIAWKGLKGFAVKGELRAISIDEMKHAEAIAARLTALGGRPTTKPTPIIVDDDLHEQLARDVADEIAAIELYRRIIARAMEEQDLVTAMLFRAILMEEEAHHGTFEGLLEEL